jgi:hypothetical protein
MSPTPVVCPWAVDTAMASTDSSTRAPTWPTMRSRSSSPVGLAQRRDRGADDEAERGVAAGFAAGLGLAEDLLDVGDGDEAAQAVRVVDDQHLGDADVFGEEVVGLLDRVLRHVAHIDGEELLRGVIASVDGAGGRRSLTALPVSRPQRWPEASTTGNERKSNFFCSIIASTSPTWESGSR